MDSIISNEKKCFVCGTPHELHKHHIFGGFANRPLSEKHGCWVYLCAWHHNASDMGVHRNHSLDLELKRLAQTEFGKKHSRSEFIKIFTRSYL